MVAQPNARLIQQACGVAAAAGFALLATRSPFLSAGIVLGLLVLAVTIWRPLMVVGLMMVGGVYSLSIVTGGFKSLFTELGGLDMNGIRLVCLCMGLGSVALIDRRVTRVLFSRTALPYLLFVLFAAVTVLYSRSRLDGMRLLLKLGYPLLVFVTIAGIARTREQAHSLIRWMLIGAAVIAVIVTPLSALSGGFAVDDSGIERVLGPGIHQNPFSFYLCITLLTAVAVFAAGWGTRYLLLCGPLAIWIMMALTRITLLGTLLGLIAMAAIWAVAARNVRLLAAVAVVGALLAIPMIPPVLERTFGYVPGLGELTTLLADPIDLYYMIDWQGRDRLWPIAFALFLGSPWVGAGLGTTTVVLRANVGADIGPVHNEYLRLLAETGVAGTLLFVIALVWWGRLAVKTALSTEDATTRALASAALAGLVAWGVFSLTDNAFDYYSSFTQYVTAVLAAAVASSRLPSEHDLALETSGTHADR